MNRWLHDLIACVLILGSMLASAAAVAVVAGFALGAGSWPWYWWVIGSPLLYLGWLLVFLFMSAWVCGLFGRRNPKPRHAVMHSGPIRGSSKTLGMATAAMCYRRLALLQSIPLVSLLSLFRPLDRLVLRAYSPSVHIGRNVLNWAGLYDPDLTEIGNDVVLGGQSVVAAHSMVIRGDGALVYVSAPVKIGDRATIGGEARVGLGCVVGHDAIVEPGAVVEPFTRVPPGEVWGGNPARFRRRREDIYLEPVALATDGRPDAAAPARDHVRQVVAEALGLSPDEAAGDLSSSTCALWDSLGQVAIAAAVFDRFGATVEGPDVFRLKTLDDIARVVAGQASAIPAPPPVDADPAPLTDDMEMLPLLDTQAATRALAALLDGTPRDGTPLCVTVAASFTAQPVESALKLWGRAFGFDVDCRFAGYDQIVQALLDQSGPLAATRDGVTVVLTRPEDFPADSLQAATALDEILDAIEQAASARSPKSRLLVGTLPPVVSSFAAIEAREAEAERHHWRSRLATMADVELFDFSQVVERVGIDNARSSQVEVLAHGGYSQRLYQELAIALVRRLRAARGPVAKVVAVDCDNTLWGGVVGEVGLEGLQLGPDGPGRSFQLFQQYLKRLKDRGLLLVVASRNEEHDVREAFARHPGMVLGVDDIAAWRVNWRHKSENLRELAEELNLGLDSFVLIDDDPAARLEVKTREPAVHVVPLPPDPAAYCETLDRLWLFDGAGSTAVDTTRTQMAQEEQRRRHERGSAVSLEDFLSRLELVVDLQCAGEHDWPRIAQLTQRTNQFNLSLKRRTLEEVEALAERSIVLVLEARDRFGDYGQVGVCVLEPGAEPGCWEIDTFLMSCRALGRGVEHAFLHGIAAAAAENGGTTLVAPYRPGPRNGQMKDFLARAGFDEIEPDLWRLSIVSVPPLPKHVRFQGSRVETLVRGGSRSAAAL